MRAWPVAQYGQSHALATMIEAARRGDAPFSFWTSSAAASMSCRSHYHSSGIRSHAACIYQLKRGKPKAIEKGKRQRRLHILHQLAALFKQVRQQRVTDKAKEKVGSKPAPFYGPSAARSSTAAESAEDPLLSSGATPDRSAAFGSSGPLYRR